MKCVGGSYYSVVETSNTIGLLTKSHKLHIIIINIDFFYQIALFKNDKYWWFHSWQFLEGEITNESFFFSRDRTLHECLVRMSRKRNPRLSPAIQLEKFPLDFLPLNIYYRYYFEIENHLLKFNCIHVPFVDCYNN